MLERNDEKWSYLLDKHVDTFQEELFSDPHTGSSVVSSKALTARQSIQNNLS